MPRDIFISHTTRDKVIALELCALLESAGLTCWMAPRDIEPGSNWTASIMTGIAECRIMLLVFSSGTNQSEHVSREIVHAMETKRRVFPFRIEAAVPMGSLAYCLSGVQWFDATTPPLARHLDALAAQLRLLLTPSEEVPAELRPAPAPGLTGTDSTGEPADIYFACGKCGQHMVAVSAAVGQVVDCPTCKNPFIVPSPGGSRSGGQQTPAHEIAGGVPSPPIASLADVSRIESCMTGIIGPIGTTLVRNVLSRVLSLDALRAELVASIPGTDDQRAFLRCCGDVFGPGAPPAAPPPPPIPSAAGSRAPASFDPTVIAELKRTLASFVGPLAAILVDRAIAKSGNAQELLALLADELESRDDRERFLRAAPAALRRDR